VPQFLSDRDRTLCRFTRGRGHTVAERHLGLAHRKPGVLGTRRLAFEQPGGAFEPPSGDGRSPSEEE
jgi:hypothetical protein